MRVSFLPGSLQMSKPRTKRESIWKMELDELKYVCHTRKGKRWIKRMLSKARRSIAFRDCPLD